MNRRSSWIKREKIIPKQMALIIFVSLFLWIFCCDNGNGAIQHSFGIVKMLLCDIQQIYICIWWCLIKKRYVLFLNIVFYTYRECVFPPRPTSIELFKWTVNTDSHSIRWEPLFVSVYEWWTMNCSCSSSSSSRWKRVCRLWCDASYQECHSHSVTIRPHTFIYT